MLNRPNCVGTPIRVVWSVKINNADIRNKLETQDFLLLYNKFGNDMLKNICCVKNNNRSMWD